MATVPRRFFVDLDTGYITDSIGSRAPLQEIRLKARDTAFIGFQFFRGGDGSAELLSAGSTLTFGIKSKNDFGGSFLASATGFTAASTTEVENQSETDFYRAVLSLNTTPITNLLDDVTPQVEAICELEVDVSGSSELFTTSTVRVILENDIVRGTEGVPTGGSPSYPDQSEIIRFKSAITSLQGGTSSDLDNLGTTSLTPPYSVAIRDSDSFTKWSIWTLVAGTSSTDIPAGILRPADYATSSNEKYWSRVGTLANEVAFPASTELTISSGAVTVTQGFHTVDTEGDAASDDLDTITGYLDGSLLLIRPENDARSVVLKNGTGNILTPAGTDITLSTDDSLALLHFDGTNWRVIASPSSGGGASDHGALTGLGDDDHSQYLLVNGSRAGTTAFQEFLGVNLTDATELTISSGSVTRTQGLHTVDTEGDAASDDLATISGGAAGDILVIYPANDARSVVLKHGTGNIQTFDGSDITLDTDDYMALLVSDGTNWRVITSSAGGGGSTLPVTDTTGISKDPGDGTKVVRLDAGDVPTATTRALQVPGATDSRVAACFQFEMFGPTDTVVSADYVEFGWCSQDFRAEEFGASVNTQGTGQDITVDFSVNGTVYGSIVDAGYSGWTSGSGEYQVDTTLTANNIQTGDRVRIEVTDDGSGSAGSAGNGLVVWVKGFYVLE